MYITILKIDKYHVFVRKTKPLPGSLRSKQGEKNRKNGERFCLKKKTDRKDKTRYKKWSESEKINTVNSETKTQKDRLPNRAKSFEINQSKLPSEESRKKVWFGHNLSNLFQMSTKTSTTQVF